MVTKRRITSKIKQLRTERYMGWTIRKMKIVDSGIVFWQSDNNLRPPHRERMSWGDIGQAKAHIQEMSTAVKNEGRGAYALTHAQKIEAKAAIDKLGDKVKIAELLTFWERHHPDGKAITVAEMLKGWLAEAHEDGLKPTSIRQNKQRLSAFIGEIGKDAPCALVTGEVVAGFLDRRRCGKPTKMSWRKTLHAFFEYCIEKQAMSINPITKSRRGRRRRKRIEAATRIPEFMPVPKVKNFMAKAEELHPESVPALAIMFFAGLRPFEVSAQYGLEPEKLTEARDSAAAANKRLKNAKPGSQAERTARIAADDARLKLKALMESSKRARGKDPARKGGLSWSNVNLAKKFIRVLPETSKTGAGRLVEISDNLFLWLTKYYRASGPVAPSPVTIIRHRRDIMKKAGIKKWLPDVARHSYATYHFAMYENQDKLQAQMGHSGKAYILTKHYKGLATKEDAEEFWNIMPANATEVVIQLATKGT